MNGASPLSVNAARPRRAERGLTMVELIITMAVMAIVLAATVPLFTFLTRSFTSMEVSTVLPAATQGAVNRIQNRLTESRRLFDDDLTGIGPAFLARLPTLSAAPKLMLASLADQLPTISPNMPLSIGSSLFVSTNVGNSLFFASTYVPYKLTNIGMGTTTVRVDTFMFNYYYLHENTSVATVGGRPPLELWEWHSCPYADYLQLNSMAVGKSTSAVAALVTQQNILFAWDSSSNNPNTAFYTLAAPSGAMTAAAGHILQPATDRMLQPAKMITVIEGAASGGFHYSVSRNTGGAFTHKYQVPSSPGMASGDFPAGFEVLIVGPSSARQVFVRLVMAVQGNFKGYLAYQNILLLTARDLY